MRKRVFVLLVGAALLAFINAMSIGQDGGDGPPGRPDSRLKQ